MPRFASLTVGGVKETIKAFDRLPEEVKREVKLFTRAMGIKMKKAAQQNAPIDTGALRRSIRRRTSRNGLTVTIFTRLRYSSFQELGTKNTAHERQPYLRPAFLKISPEYIRGIRHISFVVAPRIIARKYGLKTAV
jgi:HK97 gp10 family phage protein